MHFWLACCRGGGAEELFGTCVFIASFQAWTDDFDTLLPCTGACQHALGYHVAAVLDYEATLQVEASDASEELRSQQFLAFYQKELALYARANLDRPCLSFCPDHEISPMFKVCRPSERSARVMAVATCALGCVRPLSLDHKPASFRPFMPCPNPVALTNCSMRAGCLGTQ